MQINVDRKRTEYILSDKDEEKKKAMEDAEKYLKISKEKKKQKYKAFAKFIGSLPKHSRPSEVEVLKVGEIRFMNQNNHDWNREDQKRHQILRREKINFRLSRVPQKIPQYYKAQEKGCLLYTSPSPRDATLSRMPSSA